MTQPIHNRGSVPHNQGASEDLQPQQALTVQPAGPSSEGFQLQNWTRLRPQKVSKLAACAAEVQRTLDPDVRIAGGKFQLQKRYVALSKQTMEDSINRVKSAILAIPPPEASQAVGIRPSGTVMLPKEVSSAVITVMESAFEVAKTFPHERMREIDKTFLSDDATCSFHLAPDELPDTIPDDLNFETVVESSSGADSVNLLTGYARISNENGDFVQGSFAQGLLEGPGMICSRNGNVQAGLFTENKLDGPGVQLSSDGVETLGVFSRGVLQGSGRVTYADGSEIEGEFNQNRLVTLKLVTSLRGRIEHPEGISLQRMIAERAPPVDAKTSSRIRRDFIDQLGLTPLTERRLRAAWTTPFEILKPLIVTILMDPHQTGLPIGVNALEYIRAIEEHLKEVKVMDSRIADFLIRSAKASKRTNRAGAKVDLNKLIAELTGKKSASAENDLEAIDLLDFFRSPSTQSVTDIEGTKRRLIRLLIGKFSLGNYNGPSDFTDASRGFVGILLMLLGYTEEAVTVLCMPHQIDKGDIGGLNELVYHIKRQIDTKGRTVLQIMATGGDSGRGGHTTILELTVVGDCDEFIEMTHYDDSACSLRRGFQLRDSDGRLKMVSSKSIIMNRSEFNDELIMELAKCRDDGYYIDDLMSRVDQSSRNPDLKQFFTREPRLQTPQKGDNCSTKAFLVRLKHVMPPLKFLGMSEGMFQICTQLLNEADDVSGDFDPLVENRLTPDMMRRELWRKIAKRLLKREALPGRAGSA